MSDLPGLAPQRRATLAAIAAALAIAGIYEIGTAVAAVPQDNRTDLLKQWVVSQYVLKQIDPYPVSLAAIRAYLDGDGHPRENHLPNTPHQGPHPQTDPQLGAPDSTYPPTTAVVLAAAIGHFRPENVRTVWLVLSILMLPLVIGELLRLVEGPERSWPLPVLLTAMVLAWPASAAVVARQQFSFLVLWAVLAARRIMPAKPVAAGLLYCVALLKPSLAIPFLLFPLAQKRWKTLAVVAAVESALLAAACLTLRQMPWVLVKQWLSVAQYFLHCGMYTVEDLILSAHLDGSPIATLVPLAILALSFFAVRRMEPRNGLCLAAMVAAVWTYHLAYDLVLWLVPAVCLVARLLRAEKADWRAIAGMLALAVLAVALLGPVYDGVSLLTRLLRWGGRFAAVAVFLVFVLDPRSYRGSEPPIPAA